MEKKNDLLEKRKQLWEHYHDIDNFRTLFKKRHYLKSQFFHNEIYDFFEQRERESAVVIARDCGKSTESVTYCLKQIAERSEDYIVYISEDVKKARKFLSTIKKEIMANKEFKTLYSLKKGEAWQAEFIKIDLGNGETCIVEAVGSAGTRGFNVDGRRPSLIILDDYEGKKHRESLEVLRKATAVYLHEIKPAADAMRGRIILIGTIVHEASLLNNIVENGYCVNGRSGEPIPHDKIPYLYYPSIIDGLSIWEERHPLERLLAERREFEVKGLISAWYMERMLQCVAPESRPFKDDNLGFYTISNMNEKMPNHSRLMTIDYAEMDGKKNDYMVINSGGADRVTGEIMVYDMCYIKTLQLEVKGEAIVKRIQKYAPIQIDIEVKGGGATFVQYLRTYLRERGINIPIIEVIPQHTAHVNKNERIYHYLYNKFYEKKILFPASKPEWYLEFKKEYDYFTMDKENKQDDGLDSLAYMVYRFDLWGIGSFQELVAQSTVISHQKNPYLL